MDIKIEDKLKEIYSITLNVYKRETEFRIYDIELFINDDEAILSISYDCSMTFEANIHYICEKIDRLILDYFKK